MMFRTLKLMDFQPYLGVITRSLSTAALSLVHFFLLAFLIFLIFAMFGFVVFGGEIEAVRGDWDSFPSSNPCIDMYFFSTRPLHHHLAPSARSNCVFLHPLFLLTTNMFQFTMLPSTMLTCFLVLNVVPLQL